MTNNSLTLKFLFSLLIMPPDYIMGAIDTNRTFNYFYYRNIHNDR